LHPQSVCIVQEWRGDPTDILHIPLIIS